MSNGSDEGTQVARQSLSSLMDGDAGAAQGEWASARWREDPQVRECWHTYHLIGDVLRTDEMAAPPARDAAFLLAVRARLESEPVPMPRPRPRAEHRGWRRAGLAVAAGFAVVAGVLVVLRFGVGTATDIGGSLLAGRSTPDVMAVSGKLIRDAELDRYLSAHRRVSNVSSVVVPGAVVRSVDSIAIDEK